MSAFKRPVRRIATHTREPWYRDHLFVRLDPDPILIASERPRIRTLDWKPSRKIWAGACMLCAVRPIDAISNQAMLNGLGLQSLAEMANAKLAAMVEAIP